MLTQLTGIRSSIYISLLSLGLGLAGSALADNSNMGDFGSSSAYQDKDSFIALGVGAAPAFPGSDNYRPVPFAFGHIQLPHSQLELGGQGFRLKLLQNEHFNVGPVANYGRKRKARHGSGDLKKLNDIKAAAELGAFAEYKFAGDDRGQGQFLLNLTYLHDLNSTYSGSQVFGSISYAALRSAPLSLSLHMSTSWASSGYMRTYFGVDNHVSARSGLSTYRPGSGFKNVTLGVTLAHQFTPTWGVMGYGGVVRYVSKAKDSPITRNHDGSKTTGILGAALSYRF